MPDDVRMRGFAKRSTVEAALAWLDGELSRRRPRPTERSSLGGAAGRVLAADVASAVDVPGFDRAMMDGYAVRAEETIGAAAYHGLPLRVVGRSLPGRVPDGGMDAGEAIEIMTGAPVPVGADAVVPAELVQREGDSILVLGEVSPGKNIGRRGEDVARGTTVFQTGRRLRPQDLGVLSSIGGGEIEVVARPPVRILVTGDELLPAGTPPAGHRIADANGPMLAALVARDGGVPEMRHVSDDPAALLAAIIGGPTEGGQSPPYEVLLVSGGSSVGAEDHAPRLVAELGELAIHGIAMRPSSPAGMGTLGGSIVFLLPGNPVSCLCAYDFFAGRAIRVLAGRSPVWPYARVRLPLARKLVSVVGRVDYARVQVAAGQVEPLAIAGASILTSTTRADGFVIVPADLEGYPQGAEVEVFLYDE